MKILISYYIPSGGMETLNRLRAEALATCGVACHLHYLRHGSGLQNRTGIPTYVSDNDSEIQQLLLSERFDAVIVSHNYMALERIRRLGFQGPVLFEVQGLGQRHQAIQTLKEAMPYIRSYCNAIVYSRTSHLIELFQGMFSDIGQFCFPNLVDTGRFGYRALPVHPYPMIGWVGRLEMNKNWRFFLQIGHELRKIVPNLQMWMFEDATLSQPEEQAAFQTMIALLEIESHLHRVSNVPHQKMADYYSMIGDSGGFLASTSILEGFGYAVAEALLCRCPVLSTDSDGVRNFIIQDQTGKFIPHNDIDIAVKNAMEIMNNHILRGKIRDAGERHIKVNFSPEMYCGQFMEMMHSLGIY
ncbi:glycosyltransferase family 4 protein [Paenibacillus popilliae]|uniref:Glycosyltransferase n=1 Tax=Paenibacillus popilliae ATCC 14706 TaxID=1212764 RepID=M9LRP9_PAEPP|nr:glycosyltransferase [Paenibacillus popilliae]GAC44151.1 glycosyltransferase [Paenibacillus popilliae ATCC 14706]